MRSRPRRRARHRAPLRRRSGRLPAHRQPARLRARADQPRRCSIALSGARRAACVSIGKSPRSVRRARHHRGRHSADGERRRRLAILQRAMEPTRPTGLIFVEPGRHRHAATGTATTWPGTPRNLERIDARPRPAAAARCGPADLLIITGRPRQRSDDAEHRSFARARAAADRGPRRAGRRRPRRPRDLRGPRPDDRRQLRRRAELAHGTSFLAPTSGPPHAEAPASGGTLR